MGLMLMAGATPATLEEVQAVPVPGATASWRPIPHGTLIQEVKERLAIGGFRLLSEEYGLSPSRLRMFGLLGIANGGVGHPDYQLTIGLRNGNDKDLAAGLALGSRVFVCDNLAFSADLVIVRKHTTNILRDLPGLIANGLTRVKAARESQDRRIGAYKGTELTDPQAHDLMVRALRTDVINPMRLPKVIQEWHEPEREEFKPRTVWSAFNAFTETLKGSNIFEMARKTMDLHALCDGIVGAYN